MDRPPHLSDEEFQMFTDLDLRKKLVGDGPLVIRNRQIGGFGDDDNRFDKDHLKDIQFIDCMFVAHKMFDTDMTNLSFQHCLFANVRWEGGKWSELKFSDCAFVERDTSILPGSGGGNVLIERCYFKGTEPKKPEYADYIDFYGSFGAGAKARYVDCEFQRFDMYVDNYMELENCKCDRVGFSNRFRSGGVSLSLTNCSLTGQVSMPNYAIQEFTLKHCSFDSEVDAENMTAQRVTLENVRGPLNFIASRIYEVSAKDCTFVQSMEVAEEYLVFGLSIGRPMTKMTSLTLENCKFEGGPLARVVARGGEPQRDKDGNVVPTIDPKTHKAEDLYAYIDTVTFRKTPLVRSTFVYSHIKQLTVEDAEFADTNFAHSTIDKMTLKNVKLSGKLDFTDTKVKEVVTDNITKDKLSIVRDKATELELTASAADSLGKGLRRWLG